MKIALNQCLPTDGNIENSFAIIEQSLNLAGIGGVDMLVFPELFLPGYNRPDLHHSLAQSIDGEWIAKLSTLVKKAGCGLTLGWAEAEGENVYNSAICFDQQGLILANYRKIQLFGDMEKRSFIASNVYQTFTWKGIKAAILICYDIEFPQHCRALAEQGVSLIFVPTANPQGYEYVSKTLVPARAHEMAVTIVYANYCGMEKGLTYAGLSLIVGPDSIPIASAGTQETLLISTLDTSQKPIKEVLSTQLEDYLEVQS